jgi:hypothetical protein
LAGAVAFGAPAKEVTFYKDVLPVLQNRCQECHRPGEAGPMHFLDYKSTRPWAKAIKGVVATKKMPPWFADPAHGKFSNDRSLTQQEIETLIAWADTGAKEGNPKDAPAPKKFVEGWNIGQPDAVIEMPQAFQVPAEGTIEYQYIVLPTGFTEDKWVTMAEVRPGNREVVHHVIAFIRPKGMPWLADAKPGVPFVPSKAVRSSRGNRDPQEGVSEAGMAGTELLVGYAPGMEAQICPPGTAKLLPAGADIIFQMHYTANGKAVSDKTKIGLVFAKEPPKQRILTMNATNNRFVIPPGAPAHEVKSSITLRDDSYLVSLMPHMHLRGKDFKYTVTYPTGESEVVLNVPRYDFNWQLFYYLDKPKFMPKGTRIDCVAHFDNSPNNPANPNPKEEVRWGDQSWEEMMIGWFDVAIDVKQNPIELYTGKKKPSSSEE